MEDDADVRRMLSTILEDEGYSMGAVDSGRQTLKTCEKLLLTWRLWMLACLS